MERIIEWVHYRLTNHLPLMPEVTQFILRINLKKITLLHANINTMDPGIIFLRSQGQRTAQKKKTDEYH